MSGQLTVGRRASLKPNGLLLARDLPYDEWKEIGQGLGRYGNAVLWAIADWAWEGRRRYGRRYEDALAVTGLSYQTIRNLMHVRGEFDLSRRRDKLSLSHHAEVVSLTEDEQDRWLDLAEKEGWSQKQLREQLQAAGAGNRAAPDRLVVRFTVPPDREERWRTAAELAERPLDEWAISVLDEAAASALRLTLSS